eukprot:436039-Alexandrium_andersonii.AAC.1
MCIRDSTRGELQDQATPGTYLQHSPEERQPSARELLERCGTNTWLFQGTGFTGSDLSFTAEA